MTAQTSAWTTDELARLRDDMLAVADGAAVIAHGEEMPVPIVRARPVSAPAARPQPPLPPRAPPVPPPSGLARGLAAAVLVGVIAAPIIAGAMFGGWRPALVMPAPATTPVAPPAPVTWPAPASAPAPVAITLPELDVRAPAPPPTFNLVPPVALSRQRAWTLDGEFLGTDKKERAADFIVHSLTTGFFLESDLKDFEQEITGGHWSDGVLRVLQSRLKRAGDYDGEVDGLFHERSIQGLHDYVAGLNGKDAVALNQQAWQAFLDGRAHEGLGDAERALAIDPEQPYMLDTRGQIYLALGRCEQAMTDLDAAIEAGNGHAGSYFSRGQCHERASNTALAIADYRSALEQPADDAFARKAKDKSKGRLSNLGALGTGKGGRY